MKNKKEKMSLKDKMVIQAKKILVRITFLLIMNSELERTESLKKTEHINLFLEASERFLKMLFTNLSMDAIFID